MLDMTESIAPKSDQLNADDLISGPRTFTIGSLERGSAEQPINVHLVESDRPWRPSKTDRRVLVSAWGKDGSAYTGKRITLYRDPTVKWGGEAVGGIRIQAMSHIDKPLRLAVTVTRGKRAPYVVQPLTDAPTPAVDPLAELRSKMAERGITAKADALAYLSRVVGHPVAAAKELTPDEVAAVIADLDRPVDPDTGEVLPVEDPPAGWDDAPVAPVQP